MKKIISFGVLVAFSTTVCVTDLARAQSTRFTLEQLQKNVDTVEQVGQMCLAKYGSDDIYNTQIIEKTFGLKESKNIQLTKDQSNQFDSLKLLLTVKKGLKEKVLETNKQILSEALRVQMVSYMLLREQYHEQKSQQDYEDFFLNDPSIWISDKDNHQNYNTNEIYQENVKNHVANFFTHVKPILDFYVQHTDLNSQETQNEIYTIQTHAKNIRNICEKIRTRTSIPTYQIHREASLSTDVMGTVGKKTKEVITQKDNDEIASEHDSIVFTKISNIFGSDLLINLNECASTGINYNFFRDEITSKSLAAKELDVEQKTLQNIGNVFNLFANQSPVKFIEQIVTIAPEIVNISLSESGSIDQAKIVCSAIGDVYQHKYYHDARNIIGIVLISTLFAYGITVAEELLLFTSVSRFSLVNILTLESIRVSIIPFILLVSTLSFVQIYDDLDKPDPPFQKEENRRQYVKSFIKYGPIKHLPNY